MIQNKKFRVTDNDLLEFNQWIKSKMPEGQKPRLLEQFDSENEYEEYMINYQNEHMSLEADPAVLKTDKHGRTFSESRGKRYNKGYKVIWVDRDYKSHEKKFPMYELDSPDKCRLNAEAYRDKLDKKDKDSEYGLYRMLKVEPYDGDSVDMYSNRTFSEEIPSDAKKVVIYTSNPEQLVKLINAIKEVGNPGHSFEIVVDPDLTEAEGGNQKFGWDGDGSDRIYKVAQEEQKELDKSFAYVDTSSMEFETSNDNYRPGDTVSSEGEKFELVRVIESTGGMTTWKVRRFSQKSFSERCEFFSKKKISKDEESGKWFIEGVEIPFETEESAKIALATMVVKGEPSDNNPDLKTFSFSEVGAVVMKSKDGGYYVVSIENDEDWNRIESYKREGDKLIKRCQSTGEADRYIDDKGWDRYQS